MKMNIEIPDEWETRLEELAKQDGHSNRSAVIRKIVNLFFANKSHFVAQEKETTEKPQEQK